MLKNVLLLISVGFFVATANKVASAPLAPEPPIQVVVWGAKWCKYCVKNRPELDRLSKSGRYDMIHIDLDKYREFARRHNITRLPAYYVVANGRVLFKTNDLNTLKSYTPKENHGQTIN